MNIKSTDKVLTDYLNNELLEHINTTLIIKIIIIIKKTIN